MLSSSFVAREPAPEGCTRRRDLRGAFQPGMESDGQFAGKEPQLTIVIQDDCQNRKLVPL